MQELINSLAKEFPLTDEGDVSAYLGIKVTKPADNSFHLKQPSSITKLLQLVGLDSSSNSCNTPAINNPAPPKSGSPGTYSWSYATTIGILLWIAFNTRQTLPSPLLKLLDTQPTQRMNIIVLSSGLLVTSLGHVIKA